jgi:hypothetical protein
MSKLRIHCVALFESNNRYSRRHFYEMELLATMMNRNGELMGLIRNRHRCRVRLKGLIAFAPSRRGCRRSQDTRTLSNISRLKFRKKKTSGTNKRSLENHELCHIHIVSVHRKLLAIASEDKLCIFPCNRERTFSKQM